MVKRLFIVLFVLSFSTLAYADGMYVFDADIRIGQPNQKAAISWDGKKEVMILSSTVTSKDIANFAWIIPIHSSTKPEVTAGDISILKELFYYFAKENTTSGRATSVPKVGVEIVETKKIDIYDITILKASNSNDLIDWLNNNGYKVPENSKDLFAKYVVERNFYFIANKINLKNKHEDILKVIENFNLERSKIKKTYAFIDGKVLMYYYFISGSESTPAVRLVAGRLVSTIDYLTEEIVLGISVDELFMSNPEIFAFLSKEDYEKLQKKYSFIFTHNEDFGQKTKKFFGEWHTNKPGPILALRSEVKEIVESEINKLNNVMSQLIELSKTEYNLSRGIATPLKIEFQPPQPYYPLEISSLGSGNCSIDVYVIANNPVYDTNGMLYKSESKEIDTALHDKLSRYIDTNEAKYVTLFSYRGELKKLTSDAVFRRKF